MIYIPAGFSPGVRVRGLPPLAPSGIIALAQGSGGRPAGAAPNRDCARRLAARGTRGFIQWSVFLSSL
jgi:hypothetical protein